MIERTGAQQFWLHAAPKAVARQDEMAVAFTAWVNAMGDWQWFITLTLDRELDMGFTKPGVAAARDALRAAVVHSRATRFVAVFERHLDGVPHVHAVLGGCGAVNGAAAEHWLARKHGHSRWKILLEKGGAIGYIGKYLYKAVVELFVGTKGPYANKDLRGNDFGGTRV